MSSYICPQCESSCTFQEENLRTCLECHFSWTSSQEETQKENPYILSIKEYWENKGMSSLIEFNRQKPRTPWLEDLLEKLELKSKKCVIDFGCHTGTLLFHCLNKGAQRGIGIDLSSPCIKQAQERAILAQFEHQCEFCAGGLEVLNHYSSEIADVMILANIIDNLSPQEGVKLCQITARLLQKGGRLFIKLNKLSSAERIAFCQKIEKDWYFEPDINLTLWSLKNDTLKNILQPKFKLILETLTPHEERVFIFERI